MSIPDHSPYDTQGHSPESPEERRKRAIRLGHPIAEPGLWLAKAVQVIRRVAIGTFYDGFIHAGNLAYMSLLSLFPFFITLTAILSLFGHSEQGGAALEGFLRTVPPSVAGTLEQPVRDVLAARNGWLLWLGGLFGLWTAGSLIETVRDILRRAYGTRPGHAFWTYRLGSIGMIIAAVLLLMLSFSAQIVITGMQQAIAYLAPQLAHWLDSLALSRLVPAIGLFVALYLLFLSLTPRQYLPRRYPKWPGALLTTIWWVAVTAVLPLVLRNLIAYDLTYGSLAGVMIVLFFFYLVGLGMVIGAELNAALAETPEEHDSIGQTDDRNRREQQQWAD